MRARVASMHACCACPNLKFEPFAGTFVLASINGPNEGIAIISCILVYVAMYGAAPLRAPVAEVLPPRLMDALMPVIHALRWALPPSSVDAAVDPSAVSIFEAFLAFTLCMAVGTVLVSLLSVAAEV